MPFQRLVVSIALLAELAQFLHPGNITAAQYCVQIIT